MVLLLACEPVATIPALPIEPGAASLLLLVHSPSSFSAYALDVEDGRGGQLPSLLVPADATLRLVELGCPLACLGLGPGPVPVAEDPRRERPPFPRPLAIFELAPGATAWRAEVADLALRARLGSLAISAPDCPAAVARVAVPGVRRPAVSLADGRVMARRLRGTASDVVAVSRDGSVTAVPGLEGVTVLAAHRRGLETWWLVAGGRLVAVSADGSVSAPSEPWPLGANTINAWIAGSSSDEPLELIAEDDRGRIARFRGEEAGGWERVECDVPPLTLFLVFGGVAWLGSGRAVAIGAHRLSTIPCDGAALVQRTPADGMLTAVAAIPGIGPLIGDQNGDLFTISNTLRPWSIRESLARADGFAPIGAGVLATFGGLDEIDEQLWAEYFQSDGERRCRLPFEGVLGIASQPPPEGPAAIVGAGEVIFLSAPARDPVCARCSGG